VEQETKIGFSLGWIYTKPAVFGYLYDVYARGY